MNGQRFMLAPMMLLCVALLLVGTSARAEESSTWGLVGTLGPSRIDMTLIVTHGHLDAGSHYFYAKHLQDIPLTGTVGNLVVLHEAGGDFTLHYKGGATVPPIDFAHSTGLVGDWRGGGKTFPVTLVIGSVASVVPGHRYRDVTNETDAQFEARVQGFYNNVLVGDRSMTARYVDFPLQVNTGPDRYFLVRTPAQLRREWSRVFSPAWIAALAQELPHDMGMVKGRVMLGAGLAFFGPKGLEIVNTEN